MPGGSLCPFREAFAVRRFVPRGPCGSRQCSQGYRWRRACSRWRWCCPWHGTRRRAWHPRRTPPESQTGGSRCAGAAGRCGLRYAPRSTAGARAHALRDRRKARDLAALKYKGPNDRSGTSTRYRQRNIDPSKARYRHALALSTARRPSATRTDLRYSILSAGSGLAKPQSADRGAQGPFGKAAATAPAKSCRFSRRRRCVLIEGDAFMAMTQNTNANPLSIASPLET
jgi:hypothetical protein